MMAANAWTMNPVAGRLATPSLDMPRDDRLIALRRSARTVAERLAELLGASIRIHSHGVPLAFAAPPHEGYDIDSGEDDALRIPCHIAGQPAEIVVGRTQEGEAVPMRLAQGLVDLVINQTQLLDQLPDRDELKNRFIHDLLHGRLNREDEILRQARMLQVDLSQPRAVILIDAADYILHAGRRRKGESEEAATQRRAQMVISSVVGFFHLPNDTICAYIGAGEVAVLKASNTRNLKNWTTPEQSSDDSNSSWANLTALKRAGRALLTRVRSDTNAAVSIGIGRYHPGLGGLALSYRDACAARSLGRRFHGLNGVHCLDELGIPAFVGVSDEQTKIDLAQHLLSPLDPEPDLLETLEVFFAENCCPSSAARRLAVHRNTLAYRLEKIASLTGLDPRTFDDAVQVRLALLLRRLRGEPGAATSPTLACACAM